MYEKRLFGESHVLVYALCRGGGKDCPAPKERKNVCGANGVSPVLIGRILLFRGLKFGELNS